MSRCILVSGAPGAGKTTLGKELAQRLKYEHIEIDDYNWRLDTEVPCTVARPIEESHRHLMNDIAKSPYLVLSGSMWVGRDQFTPLFDLAVFVDAPAEIRADRLRSRQYALYGKRVLEGGDMHERNNGFIDSAINYETNFRKKQHDQWKGEMSCPILHVDGTKSISDNVEWIAEQYLAMFPDA